MEQACVCDDIITIRTSQGDKQVNRTDIIHFPRGLYGFDRYMDFVIFDIVDCPPFKTMLSVEEGGPDFVVMEPIGVFGEYRPLPDNESMTELGITGNSAVAVLSIVTLSDNPARATTNLRGPIVIDLGTNRAIQIALADDRYSTREPLLRN
jgi:flagellar assembly factor FliW